MNKRSSSTRSTEQPSPSNANGVRGRGSATALPLAGRRRSASRTKLTNFTANVENAPQSSQKLTIEIRDLRLIANRGRADQNRIDTSGIRLQRTHMHETHADRRAHAHLGLKFACDSTRRHTHGTQYYPHRQSQSRDPTTHSLATPAALTSPAAAVNRLEAHRRA